MALFSDVKNTVFYQKHIEEGEPLEVAVSNQTMAKLGLTIVLTAGIIILLNGFVKNLIN